MSSQNPTILQGKRVMIFQQRGWAGNIGHFLAKQLQAEGCRLAALTFKNTTHEFIKTQNEVTYELVINNDAVVVDPKAYLQGDSYTLAEICDSLGVESLWPIIYTMRNYVKSYNDKYYYSFRQNISDEGIIDFVMAVYKYINVFFDTFDPQVIIAPNFVELPQVMFNLFAQKRGVPMICLMDSKVRGYYIFTHHYQGSVGAFYDRVDELNAGAKTDNRNRAKEYIAEFREQFKSPTYMDDFNKRTAIQKIRHELSPYYHALRWYFIQHPNKLGNLGATIDYRPPRILFRDHYTHKKNKKFTDRFAYYPFEKVKKCVYLPLQVQPEATIDVMAPYFSNQLETARQAAMSLPDDYTLVVKEHPAMVGRRSRSYTEKLARTPNVKLIDYRIPTEEVIQRADILLSPNSTTTAEAAFYNKPVIQLGNLGTTLKLPNVFKHTDMTQLSNKIKEVLAINLHTPEYEWRLENFVAAVYDAGFDFDYMKAWERGGGNLEKLWLIYRQELERILSAPAASSLI